MPLAVEAHVLGTCRVELALLVPPAAAAGVSDPLGAIERGTGGAVELVAPAQRPARGRRRCGRLHWRGRRGARRGAGRARGEQERGEDASRVRHESRWLRRAVDGSAHGTTPRNMDANYANDANSPNSRHSRSKPRGGRLSEEP